MGFVRVRFARPGRRGVLATIAGVAMVAGGLVTAPAGAATPPSTPRSQAAAISAIAREAL